MAIKAVIFDSDGTLINSFEVIVKAYAHVAQTFGYPVPTINEIQAQLSQSYPLPQILQTFFPGTPLESLLKTNEAYFAAHRIDTPAFEGVRQLLIDLHGQGLKLGIVTGNSHAIHELFRHHDFEQYFSSIVHCDRVDFAKPHPEGFLLAAEECGVRPEEAIMVGDAVNDILAGKNAHAGRTIGITHGQGTRPELTAANADHVVASIEELRKVLSKCTA